jgi:hypothetical protein
VILSRGACGVGGGVKGGSRKALMQAGMAGRYQPHCWQQLPPPPPKKTTPACLTTSLVRRLVCPAGPPADALPLPQ